MNVLIWKIGNFESDEQKKTYKKILRLYISPLLHHIDIYSNLKIAIDILNNFNIGA